ncbi:MAG: NYN domain-containing protein [Terriglobales bacterium]
MQKAERVAIYLDAAYLFKASHSVGIRRICFRALKQLLAGDRQLVNSHYYDAPSPPMNDPHSKERFLHSLRQLGWRIFMGRLHTSQKHGHTVYTQKMVDTKLTADLVLAAANQEIDTAIIVAGDADFVPAVIAARKLGVHVELYFLDGDASVELQRNASQSYAFERQLRQFCATQTFQVQGRRFEQREDSAHAEATTVAPSPNTVAELFAVSSDGYIEVTAGRVYHAKPGERIKVRQGGTAYIPVDARVWALNGSTVYAADRTTVRASKEACVHDWVPGQPS